MCGFEEARHFLEVDAGGADVILQPEIVSLAALREQTLFDDHIGDDLIGGRIVFERAVRVLDEVDAHGFDEMVGADL